MDTKRREDRLEGHSQQTLWGPCDTCWQGGQPQQRGGTFVNSETKRPRCSAGAVPRILSDPNTRDISPNMILTTYRRCPRAGQLVNAGFVLMCSGVRNVRWCALENAGVR